MRGTTPCTACLAAILWTVTEAGNRLAVDPEPHPDGNAAVYRDGTGTRRSRRPTDEMPLMGWERLHKPHVATCGSRRPPPGPAPAPGRPAPLPLPDGVSDLSAARRRRSRGRL